MVATEKSRGFELVEHTADEYRELLEAGGFALTRIVPTRAEVSVIEGTKR